MAIFESLTKGVGSNETLSFNVEQLADGLDGADAQLSPTRLAFVEDVFDPSRGEGPGHEFVFEGSFTYEVDGAGATTAAHGTVTACTMFDFYISAADPGFSWWWGYRLSEVNFDLDLVLSLDARSLTDLIFAGDDLVVGTSWHDRLFGFAGNDEVVGGEGQDELFGGSGADTLKGGGRDDDYYVDSIEDVIVELAAEGRQDTVHSRVDMILPDHVENLELLGTAALEGFGNRADNELTGNGAANFLGGRTGADTLTGGQGADTLEGGAGADLLRGGMADDVFLYLHTTDSSATSADRIADFLHGADRIDLSRVDANAATARNEAFVFIGSAAFSEGSAQGQVRFSYNSATDLGTLRASVDADIDAEIVIRLPGVQTVTAADLTL